MSITPFSDDNHLSRVARLEDLVVMQQGLSARFFETLGVELAEVSGELQIVKRAVTEQNEAIQKSNKRLDILEATVENGHSLPVHKMVVFIGIEESGRHTIELGGILSTVCEHFNYRDEFVRKETHHPCFKTVGSYTLELWSWILKELGYDFPTVLEGVIPACFTVPQRVQRRLDKYKQKYM